jgi:hypothetical protein
MNLAKVHLAKEDSMKRKTKVIIIHIFGKSILFENRDKSCFALPLPRKLFFVATVKHFILLYFFTGYIHNKLQFSKQYFILKEHIYFPDDDIHVYLFIFNNISLL